MAGYNPEDLKEIERESRPLDQFEAEEGIDYTKSSEQKAKELAQIEKDIDVEKETNLLEENK